MRYAYTAIIVLLVAVVAVFAVQNIELVRVSFLNASLRLPLALLIVLVCLLGMLTGGFMRSVVQRSIQGAQQGNR